MGCRMAVAGDRLEGMASPLHQEVGKVLPLHQEVDKVLPLQGGMVLQQLQDKELLRPVGKELLQPVGKELFQVVGRGPVGCQGRAAPGRLYRGWGRRWCIPAVWAG